MFLENWDKYKESTDANSVTILANTCLIEVLESYMECIKLTKQSLNLITSVESQQTREILRDTAMTALNYAESCWSPILEEAKERAAK